MTTPPPPGGDPDIVRAALGELVEQIRPDTSGRVADYIPALACADPRWFELAFAATDGAVHQAGDSLVAFTIQSVSKPFVYALALAELGLDEVHRHVGAEPSGEAFNATSLEPGTGRPANPMINAGAIVTAALVPGASTAQRIARVVAALFAFAGRDLVVDDRTLRSERSTGDRNRALAYLMRGAGALGGEVDETLEVYFTQCSVLVTSVDLAVMGATLGNGGCNPVTGLRVVDDSVAAQVLTMMVACGMYDFAGEWLLRVGLPAKSGVSGGLVAVSPGRFGIGVFSPPLDERGNSVRAVAALREASQRFGLHLMHRAVGAAGPAVGSTPHRSS